MDWQAFLLTIRLAVLVAAILVLIGLPIVARKLLPGDEWLAGVALIPLAGVVASLVFIWRGKPRPVWRSPPSYASTRGAPPKSAAPATAWPCPRSAALNSLASVSAGCARRWRCPATPGRRSPARSPQMSTNTKRSH